MSQKSKNIKVHEVIKFIKEGSDIIIPICNGEPDLILSTLESQTEQLKNVRIHQQHALKERPYINGFFKGQLEHVSYFLSGTTRKAFTEGKCEFVPNHFHQMPRILRNTAKQPIVIAKASPIDENGYFSLGTQADYVSSFIGQAPFILEINKHMPRTIGENRIHIDQVTAYVEVDYPLYQLHPPAITEIDKKIAGYVIDYIGNGSTLQIGIGGIPNAVMNFLKHHKDLGVHTEMITDGVVELAQLGVINGSKKSLHQGKIIGTFALGTQELYDFIHENESVLMLGVDKTNDPRIISQEDNIVSINSTTEVDLYGQCASETVSGKYYSGTGGQFDFVYGSRLAKNGKSFICLSSTAKNGTISKIKAQLTPNSVVTTPKNDVDYVVTEFGVAEMKYKSISQRVNNLIDITHPQFKDELRFDAKKLGLI